jgi:KR domain
MFSSISSILGNSSQTSYAAGNLFLDNFASYRRSLGLPAQTINWGVIDKVGVVARSTGTLGDLLAQKGIQNLTVAEACRAINYILAPHEAKIDFVVPAQVYEQPH